MIGSVKALARLAMVVATWVGLTSAALAANCDTLDSCYAAALSQGAAHVTIAEPDGADCLDRVGCAIIHVGRDVRILPLSKLGAHGLAHKTPFGAAALLPDRSLIVDALPWQVNPNGLTIVLRLLRRDNSGALPGAGAIFTASTNALGDASGAMLEFGVQDDGAFYIGRRNGWTLKDGQAPFYSFDLWEPDARRLPGDVLTVAVRLEPTGQTRVDAFAADGGRLTWDQGLLETGYPLKANSYPYKGDKLPVGANDNYALLAAIGLGPGVISHRAFGAMNKMSVFGAALSDDELVAVYNSEFKGLNDPPLSVGEHPCNTGAYLNFAGETTTTPCGALTAGLPRDEVSDGPHYIVLGDGAYARPDGDPRPDARIKLGAPEREPAALWTVRTTGFNQYVFRKGGLVLAQRPGSPFLVLREPSGSAWETFSVKSLGSGWTWANLASSQRFCARAEGAERYLAVCETNPSQAYAMNGPPAAPPNLRAFPSSESVVLTWDRPSTFPGRPLQYEIEVDGSRQLVNAPSARFGHLKADQELSIKVRAQLISGGTDPSPAAELKARTLPQPVTPGPEGFEYCAKDGGVCALPPGVYVVAYGAASRYSYRAVTGSVACDAGAFLPGAPQGLCFFAPWDQVRKGPPGAVYCGRKGDICAPPPGVGASVAYYGAYGRFLAVKITGGGSIRCEFFEGYVAEGRDDACFYGVASDKLE